MKVYFYSSCERETGHKRVLGWGTFFAAVFTGVFWLLLIPFIQNGVLFVGNKEA